MDYGQEWDYLLTKFQLINKIKNNIQNGMDTEGVLIEISRHIQQMISTEYQQYCHLLQILQQSVASSYAQPSCSPNLQHSQTLYSLPAINILKIE